jgi:type II secretory pathway pseudopilin PulG
LTVSLILAIVAGLAVTVYSSQVELSRENEARTNLAVVHMAQKVYRVNHANFWPASGTETVIANINSNLNIELGTEYYGTVSLVGGAAGYNCTFTRTGGTKWFKYDYVHATNALTKTEGGSF